MALRQPHPHLVVEQALAKQAYQLERTLKADVLAFFGPIHFGADDVVRDAVEERRTKRDKLVVVLETVGGYIRALVEYAAVQGLGTNSLVVHTPKSHRVL